MGAGLSAGMDTVQKLAAFGLEAAEAKESVNAGDLAGIKHNALRVAVDIQYPLSLGVNLRADAGGVHSYPEDTPAACPAIEQYPRRAIIKAQ